ncbi:MAG: (d)CMP kinase [Proteobacteria bacterium]|nr:(d)CMP kinase [Pseudomonadota bacterium]
MSGFVIAVDGPAASGKGTVASKLAADYGLPFLDTGLLYRAVGLAVLESGGDPGDPGLAEAAARDLDLERLHSPQLGGRQAGEAASQAAAHPGVRAALMQLQQAFAAQPGGAVLDGRDIGTVIAPDAPAKLYVTASPLVRAERRWRQLVLQDARLSLHDVLEDIRRRDDRDSRRQSAPLQKADDAVLLDTTDLSIRAAVEAARRIVDTARARWLESPAPGQG